MFILGISGCVNPKKERIISEGEKYHDKGFALQLDNRDKEAVKYYRISCNLNDSYGCGQLGFMYERGRGVSQDAYQAVKYYQKACDLGKQTSCDTIKNLEKAGTEALTKIFLKLLE